MTHDLLDNGKFNSLLHRFGRRGVAAGVRREVADSNSIIFFAGGKLHWHHRGVDHKQEISNEHIPAVPCCLHGGNFFTERFGGFFFQLRQNDKS